MILQVTLGLLVALFAHHEWIRFHHAHSECQKAARADRELLSRDVCIFIEDRLTFGERVDCDGAEKRLRISPIACGFQHWALESSPVRIYLMMTQSYWAVFLLLMTPLLFAMWLYKSSRTELAIADRMVGMVGRIQEAPPPPVLKLEGEKKKKKRYLGDKVKY